MNLRWSDDVHFATMSGMFSMNVFREPFALAHKPTQTLEHRLNLVKGLLA